MSDPLCGPGDVHDGGTLELHPTLGWVPSVPEPFWVRRWFRWRPACYPCRTTFKTRDDHDRHWREHHAVSS